MPEFKTLFTSVRPGRFAVLINSADTDWRETCLRIIEFFSTIWGGKHGIIVPTDGNTIDLRFWQLLDAYDPDYLFCYRKTFLDVKFSDPAQYERVLDSNVAKYDARNPSYDRGEIRLEIEKALEQTLFDQFEVSGDLQRQLKVRLAPFYFEEDAVQPGWLSGASVAPYPLTDISKILGNSEHPTELTNIKADLPNLPTIWFASALGQFRTRELETLRTVGVQVKEESYSADNLDSLFGLVINESGPRSTPFDLSMLQVSEYRSIKFRYWEEPDVVVVGDSVSDFCLYHCLSRIRYGVSWLPSAWLDAFRTGMERARSGGDSLNGPELYAFYFVHAVLSSARARNKPGQLVFVSASMTLQELEACRTTLNDSTLISISSILNMSQSRSSIASLLRFPISAYERGNTSKARVQPFVDHEMPGFFETPKPMHFSKVDPYEHRWISEVSVKEYALPRHPNLGTFTLRSSALTTVEARVSRNGLAYFCPNLMVSSSDVDRVLVRPTIYLPDAFDLAQHLALTGGLTCKLSDKGYFLGETLRKFGSIENLGGFLKNERKRAVLDKYLDTSRPAAGVNDEGVYLSSDRRRYLNFASIAKILDTGPENVRKFVDEMIKRKVLYRGFIFKCAFCRNSDWFSVDEVTHDFTCKRCSRLQTFTSEHWRQPEEPAWYYKLDEIVYQGHSNNMAVPALSLYYLNATKSDSFLYTSELEFHDRDSGVLIAELDIFCVQDGVFAIGEAKKEDRLGKNSTEDAAECEKYLNFANRLGAGRVIFATMAPSWCSRTTEQITGTFSSSAIKCQVLTQSELL